MFIKFIYKMLIQYISDIHLEVWKKEPKINIKCDILCICGDIGDPYSKIYKKFMKDISKKFKKVFIIFGNHEFYNQKEEMYNVIEYVKNMINEEKLDNVTFLNNSCEEYEGFLFVGSILWSKINDSKYLVNDFNMINDMSISKYNNMYKENFIYIDKILEENKDKKVIILTHHMPSYDFIDDIYKVGDNKYYNQCFASDCSELFRDNVKLWIYGHTHKSRVSYIKKIKFVCNPLGYPSEMRNINDVNIVEV